MFGLMNSGFGQDAVARRQETGGMWNGRTRPRTMGLACGLVAGTKVATAIGWRAVEAIADGDLVLTFDRGLQPIRNVTRGLNWDRRTALPDGLWPLKVPAGALGNQEDMTLLPEQSVMVESDAADEMFGDPFVLIPGAGLDGFRGIERVHPQIELDVIQLHFDTDEIVFANLGALTFCPSARMLGVGTILAKGAEQPSNYRNLPHDEAAMLLDCLEEADAGDEALTPEPAPCYAAAMA